MLLIIFIAVGAPNGFFGDGGKSGDLDDEGTPKIGDVISGSSPILVFDQSQGAKDLMTAFDKGAIEKAELLYDESGGNDPYQTTSQDEIRTIYKALKNITVTGESETSVTDSYHHVTFYFEDGGSYGYSFEGTGILVQDEARYDIEGGDALFDYMQEKCAGEQ